MYFISQITQDDCAFTSLKILLANLKQDENYLYLKENEKHGPYSYLELIEISRKYGTELVGFKVDEKEEIKHADSFPMILTISTDDTAHSVVLYKVKNKYAYLLDPNLGKVKMTFTKLYSIWDGTGLLVKDDKTISEIIETPFVKAKNYVLDYVFQFLAGACFLFSLIAMGYEKLTIFSLIGLGLSIIFEVLSRVIKIKEMKYFDENMSNFITKIDSKNYREFLLRKEKYKESVFSNKNNFLYYLFISIFIVFTIIVGDPRNIICVFLPILFAICETQILAPKENELNSELEKMEVKLSTSKSSSDAHILYDDLHIKSYRFANLIFFKKAIGFCLFGICAGLSLFFLKTLNLINFLFLLFTEIYLYQNLLSLMSYENNVKEKRISYMKFINILEKSKQLNTNL